MLSAFIVSPVVSPDHMSTQTLYDKTVKNAQAGEGGRTVCWGSAISNDTSLSGSFGLRVTGNGVKSWKTYMAWERK